MISGMNFSIKEDRRDAPYLERFIHIEILERRKQVIDPLDLCRSLLQMLPDRFLGDRFEFLLEKAHDDEERTDGVADLMPDPGKYVSEIIHAVHGLRNRFKPQFLRHIMLYRNIIYDIPRAVPDRRVGAVLVIDRAVLLFVDHAAFPDALFPDGLAHVFEKTVVMLSAVEQVQVVSDGLALLKAGYLFESRVYILNDPPFVGDHDRLRRRFNSRNQLIPFRGGPLSFGDLRLQSPHGFGKFGGPLPYPQLQFDARFSDRLLGLLSLGNVGGDAAYRVGLSR